jgi:glycosyltransferase involved in cell wall biosynthesis
MAPQILIIADWYLPGYKAGGQVTAVSNLVELIGDSFEIFVFTRDRDLTDRRPYPGVRPDEWTSVGKARVLYSQNLSFRNVRRLIYATRPEIIYLNSAFSTLGIKILFLQKLGLLPACAIVLAPRGEFSPGALSIKKWRKSAFVNCASRAGLYRDVVWQASSELDRSQIATRLRTASVVHPSIHVASDPPSQDWLRATKALPKRAKGSGTRFLFIARIARMKNLLFALDLLGGLTGHVEFDIFGPIDDRDYWQQCQKRIECLPANVIVRYQGTLPHELVVKVAAEYDFFLLPTHGENFGYAILEAMAAGCPIILSDRTSWQKVPEQGAGWILPLKDREGWRRVLQQCVDMEPKVYAQFSSRARRFVEAWATSSNHRDETIDLFTKAIDLENLPALAASAGTASSNVGIAEQ